LELTVEAPTRGKAALRGWFGPVRVVRVGEGPEKHYEAEGHIRVGPAILADSGAFLDKRHCGGAIHGLEREFLLLPMAFLMAA
jgi:hypothetical protein